MLASLLALTPSCPLPITRALPSRAHSRNVVSSVGPGGWVLGKQAESGGKGSQAISGEHVAPHRFAHYARTTPLSAPPATPQQHRRLFRGDSAQDSRVARGRGRQRAPERPGCSRRPCTCRCSSPPLTFSAARAADQARLVAHVGARCLGAAGAWCNQVPPCLAPPSPPPSTLRPEPTTLKTHDASVCVLKHCASSGWWWSPRMRACLPAAAARMRKRAADSSREDDGCLP